MTRQVASASRRRRSPGLLLQIAVALAAVGVVPVLLAALQLTAVNRQALLDQLLRTHAMAARSAAEQADEFLAVRRGLAATLASDPRLAAPAAPETQALLRDSLAAWTAAGVAGLAIHDRQGRLVVRVQTHAEAEAMTAVLDPAPDPYPLVDRRAGRTWVIVPAPLAGGASLALAAEVGRLATALAPDELGDQARLLLLDRSGAVLLGNAAAAAALPTPLLEAALSAHLSGAGRFATAAGPEVVGAWAAADEGRWILVSTQPAAVAEATARRMARRSAFALALALALAALLSLAAWRGLVRPLRALLAAQRQVAGLLRAPAASSETAALGAALAALESHARDRAALDQVFLGRYQVLAILGSGGMGTVFRGWDPRLQRPVALKTIHIGRPPGDGARVREPERILAEAVRAAQVSHPNVVAVHDAEESGEVAYVAMEYVDGVGLDRYLDERGALEWQEVAPLAREIVAGLAAAHARGLVHRDVKPGNVLLGHDGGIKLADFGLATYVHLRMDAPGKVFGTPGFLAPEVLRGEAYDARADLYALGVLLFRCLLGRYPFRGTDFRAVVRSTMHDPTPTADDLVDRMPRALAEVVAGLLDKDPARRPGPAGVLYEALDRFCRAHTLSWRLDFSRSRGDLDAREVFEPAALPSVSLDAGADSAGPP